MIGKSKFNDIVKDLKVMFSGKGGNGLNGQIEVSGGINDRYLVEIKTKDIIIDTHKDKNYFYEAMLSCSNYSFKVENGYLVIVLGFECI